METVPFLLGVSALLHVQAELTFGDLRALSEISLVILTEPTECRLNSA